MVSWSFSTLSKLVLIGAGTYTICMLRKLYGKDFNRTSFCLALIVFVFCLAYFCKTVFEWTLYIVYKKHNPSTILTLMEVMVVYMPVLWDLIPICTILILHHQNFSHQNPQDNTNEDYRVNSSIDFRASVVSSTDN